MFKLTQPCSECPFLKDTPTKLIPRRLKSIQRDLISGLSFHCHKTIDYEDDSEGTITNNSQMCAGAMIYLEKLNRPNQMMRIGERFGDYNKDKLKGFESVMDPK